MDHNSFDTPAPPSRDHCPDIEDVIVSLFDRQISLSQYIDDHWDKLDVSDLITFLTLHGQNAARIRRLLHDWCTLYGEPRPEHDWDGPVAQLAREIATSPFTWCTGSPKPEPEFSDSRRPLPIDHRRLIADLDRKQTRLSHYIDCHRRELDTKTLARLSRIYGQNASRLGRLLCDQPRFSGKLRRTVLDDAFAAAERQIRQLRGSPPDDIQ
jgi:hypothetical protein